MPSSIRSFASRALAVAICAALLVPQWAWGAGADGGVDPVAPPTPQATTAQPGTPTEQHPAEHPPEPVKPPPSEAEILARTEFNLAQREYDLGRFSSAIAHYSKSYEAMRLPELLFNIAQCHRHLGQYDKAAFFYRRYLDLSGTPPNASLTRELLAEMEQRVKEKTDAERALARNAANALKHPLPATETDGVPLHKRWWFWAAAGTVVAAGITAAAVAASQPPTPTLGTVSAR